MRALARTVGGLLMLMAFTAGFAQLHTQSTRTADAFGFAGYFIAFLIDVPVALLLHLLLQPALSRPSKALVIATSARCVYAVLAIGNLCFNYSRSLGAYDHAFKLALMIFGVHLWLLGLLLLKSGLVPRLMGALIVIGGSSYLVDGALFIGDRSAHASVAPYLILPETFEVWLALWLLVKGVKTEPVASRSA